MAVVKVIVMSMFPPKTTANLEEPPIKQKILTKLGHHMQEDSSASFGEKVVSQAKNEDDSITKLFEKSLSSSTLNNKNATESRIETSNKGEVFQDRMKDIKILEAQLIQVCWIHANAEKMFQEKEYEAMRQLYVGFKKIFSNKDKLIQNRNQLEIEKTVFQIQAVINTQFPHFKKLASNFKFFNQLYKQFSDTIVSTTHVLAVSNVSKTENATLVQELNKMEDQMTQIKSSLFSSAAVIKEVAELFDGCFQNAQKIIQFVESGTENTAEACDLKEKELSLIMEAMLKRSNSQITKFE